MLAAAAQEFGQEDDITVLTVARLVSNHSLADTGTGYFLRAQPLPPRLIRTAILVSNSARRLPERARMPPYQLVCLLLN